MFLSYDTCNWSRLSVSLTFFENCNFYQGTAAAATSAAISTYSATSPALPKASARFSKVSAIATPLSPGIIVSIIVIRSYYSRCSHHHHQHHQAFLQLLQK